MQIDTFDFELPPGRIAQEPTPDPLEARLLHLPLAREAAHHTVNELAQLIEPGSLLVFNDTRVIPARLLGTKNGSGGKVEVFLVRKTDKTTTVETHAGTFPAEVWRALGKASKPLREGADFLFGDLTARMLGRESDSGLLEVALYTRSGTPIAEAIAAVGQVPLPPYIRREPTATDVSRYQTMFARVDGAVAAPTAGLHFTPRLLGAIAARGCEVASVTLHVGLGTFAPVLVNDLDDHPMHEEYFTINSVCAGAIADARKRGGRVVAVGTTVARALEAGADPERPGLVVPQMASTRILIQPGYKFSVVDQLFTNFHLPKSTLLALVCAFGGVDRLMRAYRLAVDEQYRFFSYGDAMLIDPDPVALSPRSLGEG
jgi:S-adenosylmethionine:tRNA ribosyltransferase-isomerase